MNTPHKYNIYNGTKMVETNKYMEQLCTQKIAHIKYKIQTKKRLVVIQSRLNG